MKSIVKHCAGLTQQQGAYTLGVECRVIETVGRGHFTKVVQNSGGHPSIPWGQTVQVSCGEILIEESGQLKVKILRRPAMMASFRSAK